VSTARSSVENVAVIRVQAYNSVIRLLCIAMTQVNLYLLAACIKNGVVTSTFGLARRR